jgi:L-lactate utilization protein LutC
MNVARENILNRVRAALRAPAPRPAPPTGRAIFPSVNNLEECFRQEFIALGGEILEERPAEATLCECLVAQTGSIFVVSGLDSILPEKHNVIARRDQLVPDLPAAFALLRQRHGANWPSAITLITGPSRTADIEKILVKGAQGPKRLALFFEK